MGTPWVDMGDFSGRKRALLRDVTLETSTSTSIDWGQLVHDPYTSFGVGSAGEASAVRSQYRFP